MKKVLGLSGILMFSLAKADSACVDPVITHAYISMNVTEAYNAGPCRQP